MTYSPVSERVLIAEAEAIAQACQDKGRPDLAAFPDGVAQRGRDRLAAWDAQQRRPKSWWQALRAGADSIRLRHRRSPS